MKGFMDFKDVELGSKAKHKITGITGIIIAKAEYLSGYRAIELQPPLDKDGSYKPKIWFDFNEIEIISE